MTIEATLTEILETLKVIAANTAGSDGVSPPTTGETTPKKTPTKRGRGRPPKAEEPPKAPEPPADEPETEDDDDWLGGGSDDEPEYTIDDVRAALQALQKATSVKTARGVLTEFAESLNDLTKDQYGKLIAAAEKAAK